MTCKPHQILLIYLLCTKKINDHLTKEKSLLFIGRYLFLSEIIFINDKKISWIKSN